MGGAKAMNIIYPHTLPEPAAPLAARHVSRRGGSFAYDDALVVEHTMEIYINEQPAYQVVCSPTDLPQLVLGRLLSEGIIHSRDQVETIYLCENGLRARVFLPDREAAPSPAPGPELVSTCCTGNRTIADLFRDRERPKPVPKLDYDPAWIFALAEKMKEDMPLYTATHGTHSCLIQHRGEILRRAEDIGRHNALDKVLGWALEQGIPLGECIVYTSGRIPVDMVLKVIRAGVPVFASKAMPTAESVALAKEFGLTLIGAARAGSMVLF